VFTLAPACADPKNEPPAAKVIERRGLAGEHHWVAERERRNQRAKADTLSMIGQIGE
jgi:hypothetical protein